MSNESHPNSRRNFLKSGLIAISTAALTGTTAAAAVAATPSPTPHPARFLNEPERHFLESAVDRLIPPDGRWPGATEAGVVNYIDLQMGGAWGKGDLIYRHGPFRKGSWTQGYQLEYTPAELFRRSISAINSSFSSQGKTFSQLSPTEKDTGGVETQAIHAPASGRTLRGADPTLRLIYAGDPKRGLAGCATCHGPGAYRMGVPSLSGQNADYIEQQLHNFAQGSRRNDMNMPMRTVAGMLTSDEMYGLALDFSVGQSLVK